LKELGVHYLVDLFGVDFDTANNLDLLQKIIEEALFVSNVTMLNSYYHRFEPQGCSGVVLIAESHFSFHTYPENGVIMFDIFTCGDRAFPEKAVEVIIDKIEHTEKNIIKNNRGLL